LTAHALPMVVVGYRCAVVRRALGNVLTSQLPPGRAKRRAQPWIELFPGGSIRMVHKRLNADAGATGSAEAPRSRTKNDQKGTRT